MSDQAVILETRVPEDVYLTLQASGFHRETLQEELRRLLALRFYQQRTLSLGKAARLAGMSRWQFIDFLSENQVPVIDLNDDELVHELTAVDRLGRELAE